MNLSTTGLQARKPDFWANSQPLYEVVTEDGLMRPAMTARKGGLYCGGSAVMVERALDLEGDDILYIGCVPDVPPIINHLWTVNIQ